MHYLWVLLCLKGGRGILTTGRMKSCWIWHWHSNLSFCIMRTKSVLHFVSYFTQMKGEPYKTLVHHTLQNEGMFIKSSRIAFKHFVKGWDGTNIKVLALSSCRLLQMLKASATAVFDVAHCLSFQLVVSCVASVECERELSHMVCIATSWWQNQKATRHSPLPTPPPSTVYIEKVGPRKLETS